MTEIKTAELMAKDQKEISISQFFEKNRHLLGYDNKIKALLTIVKEGVDNALDATEEARILPDIYIKIEEMDKEKYKIVIRDNGPGIVKNQIPKIFGKLLYGSKFHRLRQSRGQQGIGISGAVLYSQLTTGESTKILTSTGKGETHKIELKIDVKVNEPKILKDEVIKNGADWRGLQITFIVEGIYREHKQSVLEYLKQVAISNPYANLTFDSPNGRIDFKRGVNHLPKEPKEIKPHLYGIEVGIMTRMLQETKARSVLGFLITEFSRVGKTSAEEIGKKAGINTKVSPKKLEHKDIVSMVNAVKEVKLSRPPTDCLSPLTQELIESGMQKELNPEFVASISRPPSVYRGWPFQVEVGIAYGGSIHEGTVMRHANRVPLLYQQGDCAITKAVGQVGWKRYGLPGDKIPEGPIVIFVHLSSVWVPFTSESKEAIASYTTIIKEIKLALQDCARKLSLYLSGIRRAGRIAEKKKIYEKYAHETAIALNELTGDEKEKIEKMILKIVEERWGDIEKEENGENNNEETLEKKEAPEKENKKSVEEDKEGE
ncbi:MAG: DNA topoisomerase VI subunit B [Nanoarchaeota archaeon]